MLRGMDYSEVMALDWISYVSAPFLPLLQMSFKQSFPALVSQMKNEGNAFFHLPLSISS